MSDPVIKPSADQSEAWIRATFNPHVLGEGNQSIKKGQRGLPDTQAARQVPQFPGGKRRKR